MNKVWDLVSRTDIPTFIAIVGLIITIFQFRHQQTNQAKLEKHHRDIEARDAAKQRAHMEQQLKLLTQSSTNQQKQMEFVLNWISQFTFSKINDND
jgi:predicted histidine transporter YuiF (NhaC family)